MWVSQSSEDGEMIPRSSQHIETRFRLRPDPDFVSWAELDLCGEICHWSPQSLPVDDSELPHLAGPTTPKSADCSNNVCICSTIACRVTESSCLAPPDVGHCCFKCNGHACPETSRSQ